MNSITFCILSGITEEWSNQSVNGHWRIHCKRSRNPAWTGLTSFKAYPSIAKNPGFLWFFLTLLCDWSRKLTPSSQASWCKTHTPIMTWSPVFSCALVGLLLFTLISHWLFRIFFFLLIGCCEYFGLGFSAFSWKAL